VDIEFVKPETGPIAFYTTLHVVKNATNKDNAYKFIDTVLSTEVQTALQKPPYGLLSVNKNVSLQPDFPSDIVKSHAELASFVHHDWRRSTRTAPPGSSASTRRSGNSRAPRRRARRARGGSPCPSRASSCSFSSPRWRCSRASACG